MTKPAKQFRSVDKDCLFYDQWEYCIGFHLDEISVLRELDHTRIDDLIERRKQWREIAQQRWTKGQRSHGTIMSRRWRDITDQTRSDLHNLAELLLSTAIPFKLVVSVNQGYVYTNNLALIDQLDIMPELTNKSYARAHVTRPRNTIQLKNPRHAHRTYFRMVKLTSQQKQVLVDFLQNQQGHARLSPALVIWLADSFLRTQDYFFVDHDTASWSSMLSLVRPGIIRKTLQIVTAK